jgi:hypothetical protein
VNILERDHECLTYYKVLPHETKQNGTELQTHQVEFYNGKKLSLEDKENLYMDTLFHHEKDRLWHLIKNIDMCPEKFKEYGQSARLSLLLHGPPGTGKSTFTYRMAMCLTRDIMSMDIRDFSRADLYHNLYNPSNGRKYQSVIYMFEEFDVGIKELYLRAKLKEKSTNRRFDSMSKVYSIEGPYKKKGEDSDDYEYDSYCGMDIKSDLNLRDLLEIFQGPIPLDRMLIIATTNKYDEIKEMCPELFRPGRLTPICFGYIHKDTLQDISKYYFNQKLDIYIPDIIKLPTSQIIELAMESKLRSDNNFEYFRNGMQKLFDSMQ